MLLLAAALARAGDVVDMSFDTPLEAWRHFVRANAADVSDRE